MKPATIRRFLLSMWSVMLLIVLAACGSTVTARTAPTASPAAVRSLAASRIAASSTVAGGSGALVDVGLFVRTSDPIQTQNRVAASAVHLAVGDTIQFPAGMQWDPPPGVSESPPYFLAPSVTAAGQKLYITVYTDGGSGRFAQIDDRTFRVAVAGDVLIDAQDAGRADHQVATSPAGHLLLDPAPVAGNVVAIYGSGEALDVYGMTVAGRLAPVRRTQYPTEWYFNMCDQGRCSLSYRVGPLVAPFSGIVVCQNGAGFDLDGNGFRLQFRDAGTLRNNPTWIGGTPAACGQSHTVRAGEAITQSFVHYIVTAMSDAGEPLSVAVAYDGTLYVGHLSARASCPPCRGV